MICWFRGPCLICYIYAAIWLFPLCCVTCLNSLLCNTQVIVLASTEYVHTNQINEILELLMVVAMAPLYRTSHGQNVPFASQNLLKRKPWCLAPVKEACLSCLYCSVPLDEHTQQALLPHQHQGKPSPNKCDFPSLHWLPEQLFLPGLFV